MYVFQNNVSMDIISILTLFLVFSVSLCVGSFLAAFTYRLERDLDFVSGRSFCDNCKKSLNWFDNIPLFSFLIYGGKSRCCNKKISIRYPLIELVTAVIFTLLFVFSFSPVYYIVFLITFSILIIDLETMIIPDELVWLLLIVILTFQTNDLFLNIFVSLIASCVYLFLNLVTKGKGMGLGDVKLAIPLSLFLGQLQVFNWFLTSFILGGIVATFLLLFKKANLKTKVAFGPFMIISFWIITLLK